MKRGILLLNFGGPDTIQDVKPFLYRLFSDPNILVGIPSPFRQALAFFISQVKGPSSERSYAAIGGGSPQLKWTRHQSETLQEHLLRSGQWTENSLRVVFGMRSWKPSIETAVKELYDWGAEELSLLPLFPQYSTTTTGSCLQEVFRQLKAMSWRPRLTHVKTWHDHPGYVGLMREFVRESLAEAAAETNGTRPHLVFSAHSLPLKVVAKGDPYPQEVTRTVTAIAEGLEVDWSLAYQSRNGRLPWLEPYLERELERLGREGVRNVVVCPISFVSDHIETLWELDLLYAELARKSGIAAYRRVKTFNGDPRFIEVLGQVLESGIQVDGG